MFKENKFLNLLEQLIKLLNQQKLLPVSFIKHLTANKYLFALRKLNNFLLHYEVLDLFHQKLFSSIVLLTILLKSVGLRKHYFKLWSIQ